MKKAFPKIVGIVNVTPDSFSDGGLYFSPESAIEHAEILIAQGADMLDIGGESTRPGAAPVPLEEELRRVIPVIEGIRRQYPTLPLSIDTTKSVVAEAALDAGATMINDISAGRFDPHMFTLAARRNVPIVLMHMQGEPRTMQRNPIYQNVVAEVFEFLQERIVEAQRQGVCHVIADVGIGFGKTLEHNLALLRNLDFFLQLDVPLYLGISRKSFLGTVTGIQNPLQRDVATALMHALLLPVPIEYIRVHNVELLQQLRRIWQVFNEVDTENACKP